MTLYILFTVYFLFEVYVTSQNKYIYEGRSESSESRFSISKVRKIKGQTKLHMKATLIVHASCKFQVDTICSYVFMVAMVR